MTPFVIRPHVSEATFAFSLALNGVAIEQETSSTSAEIWGRFEDESEKEPFFLGSTVPGTSLRVPIELKGRDIRLFVVSQTEEGQRSVAKISEAEQVVFSAPARAFSGEEVIEAGETLDAFDLINIYDDGGTPFARKADASDSFRPAVAFVVEAASAGGSLVAGEDVRLFFGGNIITTSGRTPGAVQYLSETAGLMTETAPVGSGKVVQVIGRAISATKVIFEPDEPVTLP